MRGRYVIRLIGTFLSRFKLILLGSLALGIAVFFLLNRFGPSLFLRQTEKIGIVGRFNLDSLPDAILNNVSEGLTRLKEDGTVGPGIASSWENKDGGKTWIFHLDPQKKWQDGKAITSTDLKFSFSDVTVEKPDSKTVVFKLQSPFAPFPIIVASPLFKKGFLGDGNWKITKFTVVGANAEKIVMQDKAKNQKIFIFYPTEERAKLAFKLGQVASLPAIFNPYPFTGWKTVQTQAQVDLGKYAAIFFNTQKEAPTADKNFRQALSYAINKNNLGERALGPISPNSWAYNPQVKPYDYDLKRAKELVNALPKEEKNATLKLYVSPILVSLADKIAKDWKEAGINTSIQVSSGIPDQFDAFLAIFDIPTDPDQYALWHSNQESFNIAHYSNTRIDKLLEDGRTQLDSETRKRIYLDFQRFLLEDAPAAFLYHPQVFSITKK